MSDARAADDALTFVLCIENNGMRDQALLLCESIRAFAGRHRNAPILAISPRPGLGVDPATRRRLAALSVTYVEEPLNRIAPAYGSANRVVAAAWAEAHARSTWLVVLDSDTVFLAEPVLPADADVAVRPVDIKGCTSAGDDDPFDVYWQQLAAVGGLSLECLPFIQTTDGRHRVRASYNGGLTMVRRSLGILGRCADLFGRSIAADLKPWKGSNKNVHASTGWVGVEAGEFWGSNQAAAALSIWSTTQRVVHLPDSYNVPLHMLADLPDLAAAPRIQPLVHVHYHWMFNPTFVDAGLATLRTLGIGADRLTWLTERVPLR